MTRTGRAIALVAVGMVGLGLLLARAARASGSAVTLYPVPTPHSYPYAVTLGPDGNIWFCEQLVPKIGRITPAGIITEFPIGTESRDSCYTLTAGSDGGVWFARTYAGSLGRISMSGAVTSYQVSAPYDADELQGVTLGPGGAIWFTAYGNASAVGRVTPGGTVTMFPMPEGAGPLGITTGPEGNLWVVGQRSTTRGVVPSRFFVARVTTAGQASVFPYPSQSTLNTAIATVGDAIWVGDFLDGTIYEMRPDGSVARTYQPLGPAHSIESLTRGPDGNLWVGSPGAIVALNPSSGAVTVHPLGVGGDDFAIAFDHSGNLWFAGRQSNLVGRLALGGEARARGISFVSSFSTWRDLDLSLPQVAVNVAVGASLVFLIPFPAEIFNRTFRAHYDEVMRWLGRLRPATAWTGPARGRFRAMPPLAGFGIALGAAALIYGFLNPGFGFNRDSIAFFVGMVLALLVTTVGFALPGILYTRRVTGERPTFRPFAGGLPLAAGCVLISRAASFSPGYVYGVLAGASFERELTPEQRGRRAAIWAGSVLGATLALWLALTPLFEAAKRPGAGIVTLVAGTVASGAVVGGLEGVAFGLLPLRFLEGDVLRAWNARIWAVLFGLALFAFVYILLNPRSGYAGHAPFVTTMALYLGFGLFSLSFWSYFRYRDEQPPPTAREPIAEDAEPSEAPGL